MRACGHIECCRGPDSRPPIASFPAPNEPLVTTVNFGTCAFAIFFFQAEDGIRDTSVTGVQTCALPISRGRISLRSSGSCAIWQQPLTRLASLATLSPQERGEGFSPLPRLQHALDRHSRPGRGAVAERRVEIGRASCRERGEIWVGTVAR